MLNQKILIASIRLKESINTIGGEISRGSCFGITDSRELRPAFPRRGVVFKKTAEPLPESNIDRPF